MTEEEKLEFIRETSFVFACAFLEIKEETGKEIHSITFGEPVDGEMPMEITFK